MILRSIFTTLLILILFGNHVKGDNEACADSGTLFSYSETPPNEEEPDYGSLTYTTTGTKEHKAGIGAYHLEITGGTLTFTNPSSSLVFTLMLNLFILEGSLPNPLAEFNLIEIQSDEETIVLKIDTDKKFVLGSNAATELVPFDPENMFHFAVTCDAARKISVLLNGVVIDTHEAFPGTSISSITIGSADLANFIIDDLLVAPCALSDTYIKDYVNDVDECLDVTKCEGGTANCVNTVNSYRCMLCSEGELLEGLLADYSVISPGIIDHSFHSPAVSVLSKELTSAVGGRLAMNLGASTNVAHSFTLDLSAGYLSLTVAFWFKLTTELTVTIGTTGLSGSSIVILITTTKIQVTINSNSPIEHDAPFTEGILLITVKPTQLQFYTQTGTPENTVNYEQIPLFKKSDIKFENTGGAEVESVRDIRIWPCGLTHEQALLEVNREYSFTEEDSNPTFSISNSARTAGNIYETAVQVSAGTSQYFTLELISENLGIDCTKSYLEIFDALAVYRTKLCAGDSYPKQPHEKDVYIRYVSPPTITDTEIIDFTVTRGMITDHTSYPELDEKVKKGYDVIFTFEDLVEDLDGATSGEIVYKLTRDFVNENFVEFIYSAMDLSAHEDCTKTFIEFFTDEKTREYKKICPADLPGDRSYKTTEDNLFVRMVYSDSDTNNEFKMVFFNDEDECLKANTCGVTGACQNNEDLGSSDGYAYNYCKCIPKYYEWTDDNVKQECQDLNECTMVDGGNLLCNHQTGVEAGTCENEIGTGYVCNCNEHFESTPDLTGCQDFNDCDDYKCTYDEGGETGGKCINNIGAIHTCNCDDYFTEGSPQSCIERANRLSGKKWRA